MSFESVGAAPARMGLIVGPRSATFVSSCRITSNSFDSRSGADRRGGMRYNNYVRFTISTAVSVSLW